MKRLWGPRLVSWTDFTGTADRSDPYVVHTCWRGECDQLHPDYLHFYSSVLSCHIWSNFHVTEVEQTSRFSATVMKYPLTYAWGALRCSPGNDSWTPGISAAPSVESSGNPQIPKPLGQANISEPSLGSSHFLLPGNKIFCPKSSLSLSPQSNHINSQHLHLLQPPPPAPPAVLHSVAVWSVTRHSDRASITVPEPVIQFCQPYFYKCRSALFLSSGFLHTLSDKECVFAAPRDRRSLSPTLWSVRGCI